MVNKLTRRLPVIAFVVVLLLTAGVTTAMARGNTSAPNSSSHDLPNGAVLERAAEILGIEADALASALQQARQEIQRQRVDERVARLLRYMVEAEGITDEQAREIFQWWRARPEGATPRLLAIAYRPHLGPGLVLSPLVERGRLTQDEADAIRAWWDDRPEYLEPHLVIPRTHIQKRPANSRPNRAQIERAPSEGSSLERAPRMLPQSLN